MVTGTLTDPGIGSLDPAEPILRYVDLSTTHISSAQQLTTPDWARTVIPGPKGSPLLYTGVRAGLPTAVLAFEPRRSDLPLQVAFPILLSNLTGELLGGSTAPTEAVAPGAPVSLQVPSGATGVSVTRPDGTTTELVPSLASGSAVTYALTDLPGIYTVTPTGTTAASPAPSGSAALTPRPSASAGAGPSASAGATPLAVDPNAPVRFAVDLFDLGESSIAPGSPGAIEALGTTAAVPGASAAPGTAAVERPTTRDELWVPIVLVVLLGLCLEWAIYHRDAVIRVRRSLGDALGRRPDGGTA